MVSPGTGSDIGRAVATDTSGNIYVTGVAQEGAWYIATFRFNAFLDSIWQQNLTTNALQGRKIARDGSGSLYIVGDTYDPHWLTLKYSIAGALQWSRVYSNDGYAADMALDAAGNVYVAGNAYGTFGVGAYGVLKYNAAGDSLWLRIHDSPPGVDILAAMHLFGVDDFVVTGSADGLGQIVTVRYSTPVSVPQSIELRPGHFALSQNYPNPFNASTVIHCSLPVSRYVMLRVFDFLGREVATLVDGVQPAGKHSVQWKPADEPSGVYFYRLAAGEFVATKKLLLLK